MTKWIVLAIVGLALLYFVSRGDAGNGPAANTGGAIGQIGRQIEALAAQRAGEGANAGDANAGAAAAAAAADAERQRREAAQRAGEAADAGAANAGAGAAAAAAAAYAAANPTPPTGGNPNVSPHFRAGVIALPPQ